MWDHESNATSSPDRPCCSVPCFQTPSICVLPLIWGIAFHTHTTPIHSCLNYSCYIPSSDRMMSLAQRTISLFVWMCRGKSRKTSVRIFGLHVSIWTLDLLQGKQQCWQPDRNTVFPVMFCFTLRGAYRPSKFPPHFSGSHSQGNAVAGQAGM
jgi:hypothetical protein